MKKKNKKNKLSSQQTPISPIVYVSSRKIEKLPEKSITVQKVGQKALGLSCLPKAWTLPFVVVSDQLATQWIDSKAANKSKVMDNWAALIIEALKLKGVRLDSPVIVRSSGQNEGIDERGNFYSKKGILRDISFPLQYCLEKLSTDSSLEQPKIPLVVQKCVAPTSAIGHLSNERRFYKELRDWLGVFDEPKAYEGRHFPVNNRNWREKIDSEKTETSPLMCNLIVNIPKILRIPAFWGYVRGLRLHFEWVWDGDAVYIVQADKVNESIGIEPEKMKDLNKQLPPQFTPTFLKEIDLKHGKKYEKIRNALLYKELGLLNTKLYILDDQDVIKQLAAGNLPTLLRDDLAELVKWSLVIRMDIDTGDLKKRQLLPRTNEMRNIDHAIQWLVENSAEMQSQGVAEDIAFVFHNFIPAISSAFTYAAPGHRKVQIEALWGLPEGLYYNSHDKFIVDTKKSDYSAIKNGDIADFAIRKKINYKQFFVTPDVDGHWKTQTVKPPYDWRRSIIYEKWIRELAIESRKIAEEEDNPISIMWLIGVPKQLSPNSIIPWYHEPYDPKIANRKMLYRKKTPFDKILIIRTKKDVEELEKETEAEATRVRQVRIQPNDERLLRDKDTLKKIGKLAKKIDAVILLEGGVLSHAYYQLVETNAIVEVKNPFSDLEDTQEFEKLVRDKVPDNIEKGGEIVHKATLSGDYLIRALRQKLIEEAFEVLDALDHDSIVGELADVSELIDEILVQLGVEKSELKRIQEKKKTKAGGFNTGVVLLKTENPLPTKVKKESPLFEDFNQGPDTGTAQAEALKAFKDNLDIGKWSDRRRHRAASETVLKLKIPFTLDEWTENSPEIKIDQDTKQTLRAKVSGSRKGSNTVIEISFYTPNQQLKLFDIDD